MSQHTHYIAPGAVDRAFNGVVRWLTERGVNLAGSQALTVAGRVSGRPQTIPVNLLTLDGSQYLVAVRGETDWVRNARAARRVELRRGRRRRDVGLTEVAVDDRARIIATYLDKWGWEVGRFLPAGVTPDSSVEELAGVAHLIPVFAVE
ncbi:nitroreductase/quinone reductase family protein [Gordonia crocea]|uniref:Nitroreductase n=1 Tax=Gordonia crocea TaxID=589162 RepID=A0A7I9V2U1_9ACTN|nr:nitroreductase/quinone reductase family protein [Gordonia crocea]GED99350.1 nitroreductase [Gordonia crocea]